MVAILFSGSSSGQCLGMPGPAAAYALLHKLLVNVVPWWANMQ